MSSIETSVATVDVSPATMALLFPSPVMYFDWPDSQKLNEALRDIVLQRRQISVGVVKTNRGGWQSDTDLQDWPDPAVKVLVSRMITLVREYIARQIGRHDPIFDQGWSVRAWANVNEKGHFNRTHDHLGRQSFFSGIYYVNVGDIESGKVGNGRTRFEDWTHVAIDINQESDVLRRDYIMTPRNSRMVLFPASLLHSVETYGGDTQRITIAFNLYHPGFGIPRMEEYMQRGDWWWANFRGLMIAKRKLPEKLFALTLFPGQLLARKVDHPLSIGAWWRHIGSAMGHATALASERFEAKRKL